MPRSSTAALMAATLFALVPITAPAQEQGQAVPLPPGAGAELVAGVCAACHQTNMITASSGYTRDGWKE